MYVVQGFLDVQLRERERDITFRTEWCYWLGSWRGTLSDSSRIVLFYPAKSLKKMKFPLTRNSDFFCEMEWAVLSKPLFLQLFCTRRKGITAGGKLCVCVLWLAHQSVVVQCKCSTNVDLLRSVRSAICNLWSVWSVWSVRTALCKRRKQRQRELMVGVSLSGYSYPPPPIFKVTTGDC